MQSASWKDIAELVGIAAIVASLIFVGLQMKQSQEIAIAAQYQERATAANDLLFAFMANASGEFGNQLIDRANREGWPEELVQGLTEMDPADIDVMALEFFALMTLFDNNYFQFETGFLDEDSWIAIHNRLTMALGDPLHQQLFKLNRQNYRPQFQAVVDQALADIEMSSH